MLVNVLTTVLELLGLALIVLGAHLVYEPAGYVVAGVILIGLSWRMTPRARTSAPAPDGAEVG